MGNRKNDFADDYHVRDYNEHDDNSDINNAYEGNCDHANKKKKIILHNQYQNACDFIKTFMLFRYLNIKKRINFSKCNQPCIENIYTMGESKK